MSDAVWLAILVAIPSILTVLVPLIMAKVNNAQKNLEREADWARQDAIAARLAIKVSETASTAAVARSVIAKKLDVVHTLVNGNVTEYMHRELEGLRRELELLNENRMLKVQAGQAVDPMEEVRAEFLRARVVELSRNLAVKLKADAAANEQAAANATEQ